MKNVSKKSLFARLFICVIAMAMVLSACAGNPGTPAQNDPKPQENQPQGGSDAQPTATRFEAEYATINGSVPGLVSVFYGASNKCMLEPIEGASNGYVVGNCYVEGNEDDIPSVTFTITSDVEAEATITLGVGPDWAFDASFVATYNDTDVNTAYPVTVNGEALTTTTTITAPEPTYDDENSLVKTADTIVAATYGTVTLKAGENTITVTGTAASKTIDYLEIATTATVSMEKNNAYTYRTYDEDEMEFVEKNID